MPSSTTRERPIIFDGESVRAILAGRKTQTRRVVRMMGFEQRWLDFLGGAGDDKSDPANWGWRVDGAGTDEFVTLAPDGWCDYSARCAYGRPGDRLWVRETWASTSKDIVAYRSDGECGAFIGDGGGGRLWIRHGWILGHSDRDGAYFGLPKYGGKWRSPIHMPRWASRLTLDVTDVRVERLQMITDDDARAEGVSQIAPSPQVAFQERWDSANPWVWVVTFSVVNGANDGN